MQLTVMSTNITACGKQLSGWELLVFGPCKGSFCPCHHYYDFIFSPSNSLRNWMMLDTFLYYSSQRKEARWLKVNSLVRKIFTKAAQFATTSSDSANWAIATAQISVVQYEAETDRFNQPMQHKTQKPWKLFFKAFQKCLPAFAKK